MTERDNKDPTRAAKRLQTKLRGLGVDDSVDLTMAEVALLDRGLAALVECYARGKDDRAAFKRMESAK